MLGGIWLKRKKEKRKFENGKHGRKNMRRKKFKTEKSQAYSNELAGNKYN